MTLAKNIAVATVCALVLALAGAVPFTAHAANAPQCILNTIVQPFNNGGTTLSWKVTDAHTIYISGIGNVTDADSIVVYPNTVTSYTLTATGNGGIDTCTVTVQPTSAYSFGHTPTNTGSQTCSMWVDPDFVTPGGTAILSWNVGGTPALVSINNGVGNVGNNGSRTVPTIGVPQTFMLTAQWANGVVRNCSATVYPTSAMGTTYYGNTGTQTPYINTTYTHATPGYVPISHVPYTGTSDVLYVLALLSVALGSFTVLYTQRNTMRSVLASFSPVDNDDFVEAAE